jgi:hypothetical protein
MPGSELGRKGKNPKPRKRIVIDPVTAQWVRQIFEWFVLHSWSLKEIAKELTRRNVPKDHRSSTPGWHPDYVRGILEKPKYVGLWEWGKKTNRRDPFSGQISQESRPLSEVAQWTRSRPHLRIVDDEIFAKAQAKLDQASEDWARYRNEKGHLQGSRKGSAPPKHLLQSIIKCGKCGSTFHVLGDFGKRMGCSGYPRGLCTNRMQLSRSIAQERILQVIGHHLLANPIWVDQVVAEEDEARLRQQQQQVPAEVGELERGIAQDQQAIRRLTAAIETSDEDVELLADRLRERRRSLRLREERLAALKSIDTRPASRSTREQIMSELGRLNEVLQDGGPDANVALRNLVGGQIVVHEREQAGRKRRYYVGNCRLAIRLHADSVNSRTTCQAVDAGSTPVEVEIEFRSPPPWARFADAVKERVDRLENYALISQELGCTEKWAAKALAYWYHSRGLSVPDLRFRSIKRKERRLAEEICNAVATLWDQGVPIQDIAKRLGVSRDVVRQAVAHNYSVLGERPPDGRHRRKAVNQARRNNCVSASTSVAAEPSSELSILNIGMMP